MATSKEVIKSEKNYKISENLGQKIVEVDKLIQHHTNLRDSYQKHIFDTHPMSLLIHNHNLAWSCLFAKYVTRSDKNIGLAHTYNDSNAADSELLSAKETINDNSIIKFDESKHGLHGYDRKYPELNGSIFYSSKVYLNSEEHIDVLYLLYDREVVNELNAKIYDHVKNFIFLYEETLTRVGNNYSSIEGISNDNIHPMDMYDEGFGKTVNEFWAYSKNNKKKLVFETSSEELDDFYDAMYDKFHDIEMDIRDGLFMGVQDNNQFEDFHSLFMSFKTLLDNFTTEEKKIELMKDLEVDSNMQSISSAKDQLLDKALTIHSKCEDLQKIWRPIAFKLSKYNKAIEGVSKDNCLNEVAEILTSYKAPMKAIYYPWGDMESQCMRGLELSDIPNDTNEKDNKEYIPLLLDKIKEGYLEFLKHRLNNIFDNIGIIDNQFNEIISLFDGIKKDCKVIIKSLQTKEDRSLETGTRRLQEILKSYKMISRLKTDQSYYSISDSEFNSWVNKINEAHKDLLKLTDNNIDIENNIEITHMSSFKKKMNWDEYKQYVQGLKIKSRHHYHECYDSGETLLVRRPDITYRDDWPQSGDGWNELLGFKSKLSEAEWAALAIEYIQKNGKIPRQAKVKTKDGIERQLGSWWYRQKEKVNHPLTAKLNRLMEDNS